MHGEDVDVRFAWCVNFFQKDSGMSEDSSE
jgi:hypothetical protein